MYIYVYICIYIYIYIYIYKNTHTVSVYSCLGVILFVQFVKYANFSQLLF